MVSGFQGNIFGISPFLSTSGSIFASFSVLPGASRLVYRSRYVFPFSPEGGTAGETARFISPVSRPCGVFGLRAGSCQGDWLVAPRGRRGLRLVSGPVLLCCPFSSPPFRPPPLYLIGFLFVAENVVCLCGRGFRAADCLLSLFFGAYIGAVMRSAFSCQLCSPFSLSFFGLFLISFFLPKKLLMDYPASVGAPQVRIFRIVCWC